jgi:hypothetical protein
VNVKRRVPRALAMASLALVAIVATACSKSDDGPQQPLQLGFVPPLRPTAAPSTSSTEAKTAPAFTSYFADLDGSAPATTAAAAARPVAPKGPDPDIAAKEAVRSRLNGCFAQAKLARGTSRNISVTFTVISTGRVSRYDISGADANDGGFYSCIDGIAGSTTFPDRSAPAASAGSAAQPAAAAVPEVRTLVVTAGATAS